MGARRVRGTRDFRSSVLPPPGCGPRLTALHPSRAALGRGAVSLGLRDGAVTLRLRERHEALLLPRLPAAEARPQLQALLFAMAARVRDLEERLEGAAAGRGGGREAGGSQPSEGHRGRGGSLQHPPLLLRLPCAHGRGHPEHLGQEIPRVKPRSTCSSTAVFSGHLRAQKCPSWWGGPCVEVDGRREPYGRAGQGIAGQGSAGQALA